jgi:conjugative relaxase-like TrwC/TraI family protein
MLSIYTLKSASQAAQYYEQGDYYIKGDSVENNVWFGKGAEELGLVGTVDATQFKELLEGKLPNGVVLNNGYDKDGKPQHRPGYDLTFSACKSASILAIVGGDTRIVHAHINAVKSALTMIENEMAATRLKKRGVIEIAKTNNIVAALFNHTDSRLLDPNLHTHCILLNTTKILDEWRTLYGDDFYNCKMALGLAYRMFFAQGLMKIGYEIEQTTRNGLFEIANFPKDVITFFSKRRVEIEKGIEETGRDASDKISITVNKGTKFEKIVNTTVSSMVTLYSRAKKRTLHKDELQQHWTQQLQQAGCEKSVLENLIAQSKAIGAIQPDNPVKTLSDALPLAIEHLTSSRHMFTEKDLVYAIKGLCLKSNVGDTQIQSAVQSLKESGSILLGSNGFLTTKDAQNIERENINLVVKSKSATSALLPIVASILVKRFVKDESKIEPLTNILSSKARFLGLESANGAQTHEFLKTLVKFTPHCTHYMLSKNYKMATNIAKDIGASKAFSTHEFISYTTRLIGEKRFASNLSSVWIINRAQQLSHQEVNSLLKNAQSLGAKILFTGDSFESTTMQQANVFKQLIDNQLPSVTLQSNMQLASNLIKESQLVQALDTMESNQKITYIVDAKQRFDTACAYVANQDSAALLVQNKAMALTANNLIRELKIANGSIHGVALQAQVLAPIPLSARENSNSKF